MQTNWRTEAYHVCDSVFEGTKCLKRLKEGTPHTQHEGITESGLTIFWTTQQVIDAKLKGVTKKSTKPLPAWRAWGLTTGPRLRSLTASAAWNGPVMRTKENVAPRLNELTRADGDYGIYAYKDPVTLLYYLKNQHAYGRIDLSGRVVEHELGYRAQVATVREVWLVAPVPFNYPDLMAKTYECPVHIIEKEMLPHWAGFYTEGYSAFELRKAKKHL